VDHLEKEKLVRRVIIKLRNFQIWLIRFFPSFINIQLVPPPLTFSSRGKKRGGGLIGIKYKDFEAFCKVVEFIQNKAHLTQEGIYKIRQIKASMNRGREE
jgi:hypothetical protein